MLRPPWEKNSDYYVALVENAFASRRPGYSWGPFPDGLPFEAAELLRHGYAAIEKGLTLEEVLREATESWRMNNRPRKGKRLL